jgi:hypothetical protein
MNNTSDDDWLRRLAGHEVDTRAWSREELKALDLAVRVMERKSAVAAASPDVQRVLATERGNQSFHALVAKARREGTLPKETPSKRARFGWLSWKYSGAALVATLAAVVIVPSLQNPEYEEPEATRSASGDIKRTSRDARGDAQALARRISTAGASTKIYQRGPIYWVEVIVPDSPSNVVLDALRREGLPTDASTMRIELVPLP